MKSINLKNIDVTFFFKRKDNRLSLWPDVSHDWKTLLVSFVCLNILIFVGSIYFFLTTSREEFSVSGQNNPTPVGTIDREALKETLSLFEARRVSFEALKQQAPATVDPSL